MQKYYCTSEKKYYEIDDTVVTIAESNVPTVHMLNAASSEEERAKIVDEMFRMQFDSIRCPSCTVAGYPADNCGCVTVNRGSGAECDLIICKYHDGCSDAVNVIIGNIPYELWKDFEPLKFSDLPKELPETPGLGVKGKCGCWIIKPERRNGSITTTYHCEYHRGLRDGMRRYAPLVNKYRDVILSKYFEEKIRDVFLANEAVIIFPSDISVGLLLLEEEFYC